MSSTGVATPEALLRLGVQGLDLVLPAGGIERLLAYLKLLEKWSKAYSLTAIRNPHAAVSHHVLDSLAVVAHLPAGTLADIGCGGGLPGIPIAIAQPERGVTLNDSNQKKIAFVRQVKIELGLSNVALHAGRVEAWQPPVRFDIAISRAFATLSDFVGLSRGIVRPGGWFAAMKGILPAAEISALPADMRSRVVRLEVPFLEGERHLVLCQAGAP